MIAEETYKKKFEALEPWAFEILSAVKKELKNELLPKDAQFVQKYFTKKSVSKLTVEEISAAYLQELKEGNEEIGEWIASRWVLKNAEVYQFFAQKLAEINPNFDEIESIPDAKGVAMMEEASDQFGAAATYIFSVLSSVVFSEQVYQELRENALNEKNSAPVKEAVQPEVSVEELKKRHDQEILKLADKYEKKLLGMQKKYSQDVDGLKKQIGQLQRRLSGTG